jgi:hypothetical protein
MYEQPTALKQLLVPGPCSPFGPGEVTIEGTASTFWIMVRVDVKDDPTYLLPIRAVGLGIEYAHVGDGVLLVVDG